MMRWRWQLQQWAASLGLSGLSGAALLLAAAAIYAGMIQPAKDEIVSLRAELASLRSQPQLQRSYAPEEEMALFYDFFPERKTLAEQLRTLHQLAADEELLPERVDYKLSRIVGTPLWRYQSSFTLATDYATLRRYVAAALQELPNAALEDIELQRSDASEEVLDAKVRLTLYYREAP
jgi:uncharacterized protein YjiS (DUF1127 family)